MRNNIQIQNNKKKSFIKRKTTKLPRENDADFHLKRENKYTIYKIKFSVLTKMTMK